MLAKLDGLRVQCLVLTLASAYASVGQLSDFPGPLSMAFMIAVTSRSALKYAREGKRVEATELCQWAVRREPTGLPLPCRHGRRPAAAPVMNVAGRAQNVSPVVPELTSGDLEIFPKVIRLEETDGAAGDGQRHYNQYMALCEMDLVDGVIGQSRNVAKDAGLRFSGLHFLGEWTPPASRCMDKGTPRLH